MNLCSYQTKIGRVAIAEENGRIKGLFFETDTVPELCEQRESPVLREASRQLAEYLAGKRTEFSLPLDPDGTPFMQTVWQALLAIPYGSTASYKDVATAIGRPKAARAVGQANGRNPIPLFIPCHRVIAADGTLGGYSSGLTLKEKLLALEQRQR